MCKRQKKDIKKSSENSEVLHVWELRSIAIPGGSLEEEEEEEEEF